MNAFAAALATLLADPNLGVGAQWQRGVDPPLALRVLRAAPDQVVTSFGVGAITATDILSVPVAVLPDIQPGDRFWIGGDTLTVQSALRDAGGLPASARNEAMNPMQPIPATSSSPCSRPSDDLLCDRRPRLGRDRPAILG